MRETPLFHTLVGAAVLLIAFFYIAYGYLSDRPGEVSGAGYTLYAEFNAIDGVSEGADVLLAGIPIGKVTGERFDPQTNKAILTMQIEDGVELPIDSAALILSDGLLGGKYIKVEPGGDFEVFVDGDQFDFVQGSIIFEELLEKVILAAEARRRSKE